MYRTDAYRTQSEQFIKFFRNNLKYELISTPRILIQSQKLFTKLPKQLPSDLYRNYLKGTSLHL